MNRLVRGSILVAVAGGIWACGGNAFDTNLDTIASIKATPQIVFVSNVDSEAVVVEAVNDLGNQNEAEFTISNKTAGLVVNQDTGYGLVIGGDNLKTRARFFVKGQDSSTFVSGSFDVDAAGKSVTVDVNIVPSKIVAALSATTPTNGDTVTITLPAGITFTSTSTVTLAGGVASPILIGVSADSTQITFVPPPGVSGPVTLNDVVVGYLPGQQFSVPTSLSLTTEGFGKLGATYNTTTPTSSDTVVLTVPSGLRILPSATVNFAADSSAILVGISADSTMLSVLVPPNTDAPITINGVIATGSPLFAFNLTDSTRVKSPVVPNAPVTFSATNPAAGATVTMTADPGFVLDPASVNVSFGGLNSYITNVSTDSTTVTFVAPPGSVGRPTIDGVVVGPFVLSLDATQLITAAASPFLNTDDPFNASFLPLPTSGNTNVTYDGGGFGGGTFAANDSRFYRITVPANTTYDMTLEWSSDGDLGLYVIDSGFNNILDSGADSFGHTGGANGNGQPETTTVALTPGDYLLAVILFDPNPGVIKLTMHAQ